MTPNPDTISPRAERLALALARGETIVRAAGEVGVSERTALRYAAEPAVRARVEELRRAMVRDAVGRLADAATEAVATLRSLLAAGKPPAVRLGAARALLEKLIDVQAHAELGERVAALEGWMNERAIVPADRDA